MKIRDAMTRKRDPVNIQQKIFIRSFARAVHYLRLLLQVLEVLILARVFRGMASRIRGDFMSVFYSTS